MADWVKLFSWNAGIGIDNDPNYTSATTEAWYYAELYTPQSLLNNFSLNQNNAFFQPGGFLCGGDNLHVGIKKTGASSWIWRATNVGLWPGVDFVAVTPDTWVALEAHIDVLSDLVEIKIDGSAVGSFVYSDTTACTASPVGLNSLLIETSSSSIPSGGAYLGVDNLAYSLTGWVSLGQADTVLWTLDGTDPLNNDTANYPDPANYYFGTIPTEIAEASGSPGPGPGPPDIPTEAAPPVRVYVDDVEISDCVLSGSVTRKLNRPWQATWRMPIDCSVNGPCSKAKVYINGDLFFHGRITQMSDECEEDFCYTEYTALDPSELWAWRPVRDDTCDFTVPTIIEDYVTGPQIIAAALTNSESCDAGDPGFRDSEGPLFIDVAGGSYAGGGVDLTGAPTDWPMTIAELVAMLTDTGEVDVVLTPNDDATNMATIAIYNGNYGTDRTATVKFEYGTGNNNCKIIRQVSDSTNVCNKLWYFLGPRVETAADPAGNQHWRANVQGDDPGLAYPPGGSVRPETQGPSNTLGDRRLDSQASCGVRMEVKIFDARGDESSIGHNLYRRLWQIESWLRSVPRTIVHVTPINTSDSDLLPPGVTPVQIGDFDIGDLVTVSAGTILRGGFTGAQRIYEYTVSWNEDGVFEIGELLTSSDQEGV